MSVIDLRTGRRQTFRDLGCDVVSERSNAELLAAAGDGSAWNELVDRFGRLVWSVARGFRFDDATTSDVSQAVWLRLYERRNTIRDPEQLASWLATTTRNECIAVQRRRQRAIPTEDFSDQSDRSEGDVDDTVVSAIDDVELHGRVHDAFVQLSPACQELLRLMMVEPKLDYATIAEILDRPIGSLGPTRARCLSHLRKRLGSPEGARS